MWGVPRPEGDFLSPAPAGRTGPRVDTMDGYAASCVAPRTLRRLRLRRSRTATDPMPRRAICVNLAGEMSNPIGVFREARWGGTRQAKSHHPPRVGEDAQIFRPDKPITAATARNVSACGERAPAATVDSFSRANAGRVTGDEFRGIDRAGPGPPTTYRAN